MEILWYPAVILMFCILGGNSEESPCKRECHCNTAPMVCEFYLYVDVFYANQADCGNCSLGEESDCSNQFCIPGDGRKRMVKAFNFSIPGPDIEVCEFDTIRVRVKNRLRTETITVHWHGIHQRGTSDMDGVPMVTQRPIGPDEEFLYEFIANPAGTHWYHSHSALQKADGVYGKLIVKECKYYYQDQVTYDYDIHSMIIAEWFSKLADDLQTRYLRDGTFYIAEEKTILVNGRGHTETISGVPPAKFVVKKGKRYRFRVIHAGSVACPIEISIENHQLYVFNSDGHNFKEVKVDSITLTNGERTDFVLNANKKVKQYGIRFQAYLVCNVTGFAILEYKNASQVPINYQHVPILNKRLNCVVNRTDGCIPYLQLEHVPRGPDNRDLCTKPQVLSLYFDLYPETPENLNGTLAAQSILTPYINKINYISPSRTLLCNGPQKLCNENTVEKDFEQCTHGLEVYCNGTVEIVLIDESVFPILALSHPFHIHGFSFMLMSEGKLGDNTTRSAVMHLYKTNQLPRSKNPILKDTIPVPDGGYVVIRFVANNCAYWLLHCHVTFHSEEGMQLVIKTSHVPKPPKSCTCVV